MESLSSVREMTTPVSSRSGKKMSTPVMPASGKGAQDLLIGLHAQRAQENGAQELALAVDAHVENVLRVVFKLHPGASIGNDLAQEITAVVGGFVENPGRTVQLADNDALSPVDDE